MINMIDKSKLDQESDPKYKRLYQRFDSEMRRLESNLGCSVNFDKDFSDNYKYNYLRDRLRKRGVI